MAAGGTPASTELTKALALNTRSSSVIAAHFRYSNGMHTLCVSCRSENPGNSMARHQWLLRPCAECPCRRAASVLAPFPSMETHSVPLARLRVLAALVPKPGGGLHVIASALDLIGERLHIRRKSTAHKHGGVELLRGRMLLRLVETRQKIAKALRAL